MIALRKLKKKKIQGKFKIRFAEYSEGTRGSSGNYKKFWIN